MYQVKSEKLRKKDLQPSNLWVTLSFVPMKRKIETAWKDNSYDFTS